HIGAIARNQGKWEEAIRISRKALQLDPRSALAVDILYISLTFTRQYQEVDQALDRALARGPDFRVRTSKAFLHELWKGETELAKEVLRAARGELPLQVPLSDAFNMVQLLIHNPREALPVLDALQSESLKHQFVLYPKPFLYAIAHEALGEVAAARKEYEAAL